MIGVSADSVDSHSRFSAELAIPFPLISDTGGEIRSTYNARRRIGPKTRRITYVINSAGVIVDAFQHELRIRNNVRRTLAALKSLT